MGHKLPRRLLVRAAAMAPITDTKADDWGGCHATRQILKDVPRPPNTASRDDRMQFIRLCGV
jgi:hypothetical protein